MHFDAAVFDLDGVVTFTARAHTAAWKKLFDTFLCERADHLGTTFEPFTDSDYRTFVDGRPRLDGIRTFLASRGICLPEGSPAGSPGDNTIEALGMRKNVIFQEMIRTEGVDVDRHAVRFIRELREHDIRVGVASSSRNTDMILGISGLEGLFSVRVDGNVSEELGLAGKPAPDIFLTCLHRLGAPDPGRALLAEDALAGVEAGRAGGFGLVIGIDRGDQADNLHEHGANWVVRDLSELSFDKVEAYFANSRTGAM